MSTDKPDSDEDQQADGPSLKQRADALAMNIFKALCHHEQPKELLDLDAGTVAKGVFDMAYAMEKERDERALPDIEKVKKLLQRLCYESTNLGGVAVFPHEVHGTIAVHGQANLVGLLTKIVSDRLPDLEYKVEDLSKVVAGELESMGYKLVEMDELMAQAMKNGQMLTTLNMPKKPEDIH